MLDLKAIFYLGEAVRHGTIRAAADSLDIEPSSISRSISRLERSLDIALVERNRRGVRVTEAGEAILRYYRAAGQQEEAILGEIEELRGLRRGVVSVVIGEGFLADFLSERTAEFFADFPGISIDLELAGTNDIVRKIVDDEADIGIVFNPPKEPRVSVVAEVKEPLCAVMPAGHALAGRRRLSLADTTEYSVALLRPSFGIRQILSEAEAKHGIHFSAGLVTDSIAALKNFVRAGFGLTYLPKGCFRGCSAYGVGASQSDGEDHREKRPLVVAIGAAISLSHHANDGGIQRQTGAAVDITRLGDAAKSFVAHNATKITLS